jgi:hypothetical protein
MDALVGNQATELDASIANAKRAMALIKHALNCPHRELSIVRISAPHSKHALAAKMQIPYQIGRRRPENKTARRLNSVCFGAILEVLRVLGRSETQRDLVLSREARSGTSTDCRRAEGYWHYGADLRRRSRNVGAADEIFALYMLNLARVQTVANFLRTTGE